MNSGPKVLILTPVKDAVSCLDRYFSALASLTYPHPSISVGFLESDSRDGTFEVLQDRVLDLAAGFASVRVWKKDFGFQLRPGQARWAPEIQIPRRITLAKSRNHLLFRALGDEDWVLWLDVDVIEYPPDIIERLLATGKDIVHPHCVTRYGGRTFDRNAWRDRGRLHMEKLRQEGDLVPLDTVGGTMLLVRADLHREGLVFPPFLYGRKSKLVRRDNRSHRFWDVLRAMRGDFEGETETEGFGIMAHDMGYECWGMPNLEILHRDW